MVQCVRTIPNEWFPRDDWSQFDFAAIRIWLMIIVEQIQICHLPIHAGDAATAVNRFVVIKLRYVVCNWSLSRE